MKIIPLRRLSQNKEERGKKKGINKRTQFTPTPLPFSKPGVSFIQTRGRKARQTKQMKVNTPGTAELVNAHIITRAQLIKVD